MFWPDHTVSQATKPTMKFLSTLISHIYNKSRTAMAKAVFNEEALFDCKLDLKN